MSVLLARHRPDAQVAFGGPGARSAGQLEALAQVIATRLDSAKPGAHVVVACSDRYFFAACLCAAWSRGLVVALPSNAQAATVHALVRRLDAVALLHDLPEAEGVDVATAEPDLALRGPRLLGALDPAAVAVLAFTSGSTGEPQAHEKSLAQLLDEAQLLAAHFSLAGARVLSAVPSHHIYGLLFGVLVPLCAGGAMSRSSPLLPADLLAQVERERADVLVAVPPLLRSLAAHPGIAGARLRRVFSSGAMLPDDVAAALAAQGVCITQVLGSTETGGVAFREQAGAPWSPLPHVRVTEGERGAMCVDSPWLSAKVARPMQTQDRIRLDGSGFSLVGRSDNVVKVGGRRVDLGELEVQLGRVPGVREARVLAVPGDPVRGVSLWAVVEGDKLDGRALRRTLAETVDPVVIPRRFRIVRTLPRNVGGKVTRDALLALFDTWHLPTATDGEGSLRITIPDNLGFFRGHFEAQPILAGVAQLHAVALTHARRRWPDLGAVVRLTRVKFRRPIGPGVEVVLSLSRQRESLVEFNISCGDEPASSGLMHFAAPSTPGAAHG